MKKLLLLVGLVAIAFTSCKKSNDEDDDNDTTGCQDTYVCFTLEGTDISGPGGGYFFADTFSFVKYEEGLTQLSLDIMGNSAGIYPVSDQQISGKARIYYFDEGNNMFIAKTGNFEVTEYTTDKVVSGTFSGTVEMVDGNGNYTGDTKEITNGSFRKIQL